VVRRGSISNANHFPKWVKIQCNSTKEILRKDKALAEAAALLVLSKKAQAIWGTKEED